MMALRMLSARFAAMLEEGTAAGVRPPLCARARRARGATCRRGSLGRLQGVEGRVRVSGARTCEKGDRSGCVPEPMVASDQTIRNEAAPAASAHPRRTHGRPSAQ